MGNIWEKLKENIERWEKCGEHGQKCGKTYGNRAKLEENNQKKGNSGKTYVTHPGKIWCGKFGEI